MVARVISGDGFSIYVLSYWSIHSLCTSQGLSVVAVFPNMYPCEATPITPNFDWFLSFIKLPHSWLKTDSFPRFSMPRPTDEVKVYWLTLGPEVHTGGPEYSVCPFFISRLLPITVCSTQALELAIVCTASAATLENPGSEKHSRKYGTSRSLISSYLEVYM